ncbi:hypothetical protein Tco_1132395 [Tanacetum coccineum]|uniref:Reverse transcriptase Ty1/copia-type domain-containing protein n=1 Tax=Tanacetum coccineum TaxID=301880 RepID=A0ABQ5JBT3_9ASTR
MTGYYFYYPLENKNFVAQNAEFFENSLMVQEASESHGVFESSESDEGLELIQEEDTQPSENTSEIHNEVEPQNVEVPIRRSEWIPQAPDRYGIYVDVEEYELGYLNEPPNYKVALSDPESDKWLKAMNTKMQSMKDNQVWVLVELPPNGRTVKSKWLFKKKSDMDGKIIRDRSKRLIALSQSAYLEKTLKKFRMENSKKGYTPMIEKPDYRNRFQQNPGEIYWTAIKTILKYVRNTKDMVLVYRAKPKVELRVSYYVDAKVEYEASMEAVCMRKVIDGLGDVVPSNKIPMEMLCDNESAIAIANDPRILKGAKHFQRKYHYIREVIQESEIVLKKVHTDDNVADQFTKSMPFMESQIIPLGQKNTLAEYMILSEMQDNRCSPHYVRSKTSYVLWKSRSENGVIRTKKYAKLSAAEKIQADCDMKATNIILQGLPADIYSLMNHHILFLRFSDVNDMNIYKMKMEQFQVNTKFLNSLPPEWSKFVTDVKLVKDLHTSNFDQLHAYLEQHGTYAMKSVL